MLKPVMNLLSRARVGRFLRIGALLFLTLLSDAGCRREPASTPLLRRVGILPGNILIADSASEWMRVAAPLVLEQDLAPVPDLLATVAANESTVYQLEAFEALRTTVEQRSKRLLVEATLSGVASSRNIRAITESSPSLVAALDSVAHKIDGRAAVFSTRSDRALEQFAIGLSSTDATLKLQSFDSAVSLDPGFGLAYLALAESLAGSGSARLATVLSNAGDHRSSFTALDRARFDFLRSRLEHDSLPAQAKAAEALLHVLPNNLDALAASASELFLSGDATSAERLMARAFRISPNNLELRRQLALGLVETRNFAQAEQILDGLASNPAVLPQVAACILLAGDPARANDVFKRFLGTVANPDAKTLLLASWQALMGHRGEAIRQVSHAQFTDARIASVAKGQVVVWQLLEKQYAAAQKTTSNTGLLAATLASGAPTAAAWQAKVNALPAAAADTTTKQNLLRNGYFLLGFYPEAIQAWQEADRQAGGADPRSRVMLAASLNAADRKEQARKIVIQPFLPDFADFYNAVSFGQLRLLLDQNRLHQAG